MPPPKVPNNISFLLTDIFGSDIYLPATLFSDLKGEEYNSESPNRLLGDHIIDQSEGCSWLRNKSDMIKRIDHQNLRRLDAAILVCWSQKLSHAKRILQSHTQMIWVMNDLANGYNLGLFYYSEP